MLYLTFYLIGKTAWTNFGVVGTIFMDLSKAFDCLPHNLIIAKLHVYGLGHDSLRLIRSYLSNPQGSILGSLLFKMVSPLFKWSITL